MAKETVSPTSILTQYWGYNAFRPLQEDIIRSILTRQDTLALLPTGGGKSICFQVPALAQEGICIVVSPLIALMKDQVENLAAKNIPALHLFTGMSRQAISETLQKTITGSFKFLYCSPERLLSSQFLEYLPAMPVSFIAVDEAHCVSQWGYDFRPAYLEIARIRKHKPAVPILALTASATPEVQQDIMAQLQFRQKDRIFAGSFARSNLSYHVMHTPSKLHMLIRLVKKAQGSGIVYCKSRRRTQEIADLLRGENISADFYHAGLPQEVRNERQHNWIKGNVRFIVCTNAFGMGIDKPDVRTVIHIDCPDSPENYYQEAGRAGRDGELAWAILLTDDQTAPELRQLPEIRYPSIAEIRKTYESICNYFGLAAGIGEGRFFDFDLMEFTKRFSLNPVMATYALQALEQERILLMSDQMFIPSKLHFTTDRNTLEWAETSYPEIEPMVKALLRTYGGIWDQPTSIFERQLCKILRKPEDQVRSLLQLLQAKGIIHYEPRRDTPQIRMLQNRVKTEDLYINFEQYQKRKEAYVNRINAMIRYIGQTDVCRTQLLCQYFGDDTIPCNQCDACTKKKQQLRASELTEKIMDLLAGKNCSMDEIIQTGWAPTEVLMNLLRNLLDEQWIEETDNGQLCAKKKGPHRNAARF
jgi:ATP-dependent DNA helicase RecQ